MVNCIVCREDLGPNGQCLRCGYDNSKVEKANSFIAYFGSFWGILSLLLILLPLFMMSSVADAILQPIASVTVGAPVSFLIVAIVAFYMYSLRVPLHHYSLTRRFKANPGRSIALLALIFFVVAILLIFFLLFAVVSKGSLVAPENYYPSEEEGLLRYGSTGHMFLKLVMTGFLIFTLTFLALSASMMAVYVYGHKMEAALPNPIYLNEALLIKVVLDTVRKQLSDATTLTTTGMKRLEDAGISMSLACEEELTKQGNDIVQKAKTWNVEADCWGRVNKIEEKGLRLVKAS